MLGEEGSVDGLDICDNTTKNMPRHLGSKTLHYGSNLLFRAKESPLDFILHWASTYIVPLCLYCNDVEVFVR